MDIFSDARLADGALWYVAFLFSTTCHEAAHAYAAMKLGDLTAYHGGQVTLNPLPHIQREPFGTVVVPIVSFLLGGWMMGWASAPYDPAWAIQYPRRSAIMSLAGPAANLILLMVAAIGVRFGLMLGVFVPPETITFMHITDVPVGGTLETAATMLSVFFSLNLILCAFNLLPLPPLDGSGTFPLVMPENTAKKYMSFLHRGGLSFFGIIIAWRLFGFVFPPLHSLAINLLYPGLGYR